MTEGLLILRLLLALLLYAFLGLALYILWEGLRRQEAYATPQAAALVVEAGKEQGRRLVLLPMTAVGREQDNTLVLDDPYTSAHHALIVWREQRWWLEDLGSHNGTRLNGTLVLRPVPLTHGDRIAVGETILRFELLEPEA